MSDDDTAAQDYSWPPEPNPHLKILARLVGTWEMSGDVQGRVTFEWMEGGFFLIQRVNLERPGQRIKGIEYIGYDEENDNPSSYFFGNEGPGPFGRVALEYVWEVGDGTFTIWGGEVGSRASFKGRFSDDRNTISGRWEWPGGGYEATMARVN